MQEPSRIREEAQAAYREHEAAQAQGKPATAQQQVVSGAHEEALAAAEHAGETLRSGQVDKGMPGMGEPATGPAVNVGLPSPSDWDAALHPRAVEPAPDHVATTGVDPGTFWAPMRWPGSNPTPPPEEGCS
ncbi:hypothetical protein ABPG75_011467 [Micractinium tetrahymenae]